MSAQKINELFGSDLSVINMGLDGFADDLSREGVSVARVAWRPPAGGNRRIVELLTRLAADVGVDIGAANEEAASRILAGKPTLIGVGKAIDDIPGMKKNMVLHAGPPVTWERMCGPLRGAVIGGLIYEGLAANREEAEKLATSGKIEFSPCHHHSAVGPMAGVVTASMPVWIMENRAFGNRAYATLNEGLGKVLRYGAFGEEVIEKLRWMEKELAPILRKAIELHGEIDMKNLIAQV
ncbi:oxamate carbamoyltransferase subunit AllG family protein, partial [Salinispira pacifica]